MSEHTLTINGEGIAGTASFDVIDPSTGEVFATAPETSAEQLDDAFAAAQRAFKTSWRKDEDGRRALMHKAADALDASADQIAAVLTTEHGKPLAESAFEVHGGAMWLRYCADLDLPREVLKDNENEYAEAVRRPIGPVAAISPWNYPIYISLAKIAQALRPGNTVVLKPSPFTPLSSLAMGEVLRGVLPAGVLNVVSGGNELGALMTQHPLARKITFTGSIATGKRIAAAAASDLKRMTLELGGNDPVIVLDDADVEAVATKVYATAFANNGQTCIAPKRVYVAEALKPALVEALAERARATRIGVGTDPETEQGPQNNLPQYKRVTELVADALAHGAKAAAGGGPIDRPGYFFAPTILTDLPEHTRIEDEEQFGPALPVIGYRTVDEALERANNTTFGLGASVWGTNIDRATAVAEQMEAGQVWTNTHNAIDPSFPFAGQKWSSIGVEGGHWGIESFTEVQLQYRAK
ncbi:aldehyde dehydrogenase family protein [Kibdelosporangium philippinense]|uniref:Aldehyde dehydrogenase family protein n=1 Tax=Kibdelosporangium philippinense TaxID=211113 RepID=A0ABS8Z5Z2_9PSEU|nr:aldehyde dehydrogenase family protein [Kibdelosporangium philippinense]MCE7002857.1 aldehyde dehydrogenase family protein [Kibdelosporangium philippinense]